MRWFVFGFLTLSVVQGAYVDSTWSVFLSNLFDNDEQAPKLLAISEGEVKGKSFLNTVPKSIDEPNFHMFEKFVESRNFAKYFEFLQTTDAYKLMQKAVALEFNIPAETQNKLIFEMWSEYFRKPENDLQNWFAYYAQERDGKLTADRIVDQKGVYAAWFKDEKGNTIKKTFLRGTTPEFDFVALTLCALQTTRERQGLKCSFELNENLVAVAVAVRRVRDQINIIKAEPRQALYLRTVELKHHKKHNTTSKIQELVNDMWDADEDRAPNGFIELDWQQKIKKTGGPPLRPLFSFVNESLFDRPIYQTLLQIYNKNLFTASVCTAEKAMSGQRREILKSFFDLLTNSKCFNLAYNYLKKNGYAPQDYDKFLDQLFVLWYGTYSRCSGPLGSSGFEHVYVGEVRRDEVDGQHNWVRYYLLEKAGNISYYGYYEHDQDFIGTFKYKWQRAEKNKGGFFISTSPAFDFSLFTVCVLTQSGNEHCRFTVNNNPLFVTSYQQKCDGGFCISTSYPGIVE
ncbi:Endoribonuclease [Aphelenchoides besseyi]|nr:Endoribonuclease [Aphelenchoides besseyi]